MEQKQCNIKSSLTWDKTFLLKSPDPILPTLHNIMILIYYIRPVLSISNFLCSTYLVNSWWFYWAQRHFRNKTFKQEVNHSTKGKFDITGFWMWDGHGLQNLCPTSSIQKCCSCSWNSLETLYRNAATAVVIPWKCYIEMQLQSL